MLTDKRFIHTKRSWVGCPNRETPKIGKIITNEPQNLV